MDARRARSLSKVRSSGKRTGVIKVAFRGRPEPAPVTHATYRYFELLDAHNALHRQHQDRLKTIREQAKGLTRAERSEAHGRIMEACSRERWRYEMASAKTKERMLEARKAWYAEVNEL